MSPTEATPTSNETEIAPAPIRVRYWAAARSAAGVECDELLVDAAITLTEVVSRVCALHPGTRLPEVIAVCSVLLGDRPVTSAEPDGVLVEPGAELQFLPPFAGG